MKKKLCPLEVSYLHNKKIVLSLAVECSHKSFSLEPVDL